MALSDRIVMALAGPRRNDPRFGRHTAQVGLGYDGSIDLSIDAVELVESFDRLGDTAFLEIAVANLAILFIAQAKHRMRHWSKRRLFEVHPVELALQRPWIAEKSCLRS